MSNELRQIVKSLETQGKTPEQIFMELAMLMSRYEHEVRSEAIKRGLARRASRIQAETQRNQQINS